MMVMWTTFDPTDESTVQYGEHGADLINTANGNMTKFVDGVVSSLLGTCTL